MSSLKKIILVSVLYFATCSFVSLAQQRETSKVAILVGDLANPFFQTLADSAEDAANSYFGNNVTFTALSSGYDLQRQIKQMRQLVTEDKVDLILLNAVDSRRIKQTVEWAIENGTSVVAIDVEAEGAQATVTSDNRQAGYLACAHISQRLNGNGRMIILNGPPVSAIQNRVIGCHDALAENPNVEILTDDVNAGASAPGGLSAMSSLLVQYKQFDAVFAVNDPTAIGADTAAAQAGRDEFVIVSVDASADGLAAVRSNDSLVVATVAQDPREMARKAVVAGARLINGEVARYIRHNVPVALVAQTEAQE